MEKRKMENIGAEPSMLGFGCMRFPTLEDGSINEAEAEKMLNYALDHGVTYVDTAYFYHDGASEPFVGKVLEKRDRNSFYLATKLPVWILKDGEDARRVCLEQLSRLRTDYVDFYLLHALNRERWEKLVEQGVIDVLEQLREEGKIRYIGFSFHDDYEVFEEIIQYRKWDFCQIQFNYMDTDIQAGLRGYELAKSKNIPMTIMEPVKGGMLANVPEEIKAEFRRVHPDWSDASWALRWVGDHDNVQTVLSGMSTMEQVIDNVKTFSEIESLNAEELNTIEQARQLFQARIQVPCTGCRYCMPCPFGLDIPKNFRLLNTAHVYNVQTAQKAGYDAMEITEKASHCQKCGACKTKCPQHIDIPNEMNKVVQEFEK